MLGTIDYYQRFDGLWQPMLHTSTSQVVNNALGRIAPELATLLTLYIVIQGLLIMFRQYDFWRGVSSMARAGFVSLLMLAPYFSQYIETPFTTTVPNFIASTVGGGQTGAPSAQQFDALWANVEHFEAQFDAQAAGWWNMGYRIEARIIVVIIMFLLDVAFSIWEFTAGALNLIVCVGPFVIPGYLFASTREVTARWLGKMLGMLVLMLLALVLVQLLVQSDSQALQTTFAAGAGLDTMLEGLSGIAMMFGAGTLMFLFLPAAAAFIGGGAVFSLATMPLLMLARVINRAGASGGRRAPRGSSSPRPARASAASP